MCAGREELLKKTYNFNGHPFSPTEGPDGKPMSSALLETALDPQADERLLTYYFDLYDWQASQVISTICATGLQKFVPSPASRARIILLSGLGKTGKTSLRNLILWHIVQPSKLKPIVIDCPLWGKDGERHAKQLALSFVDNYILEEAQPDELRLRSIIKDSEPGQTESAKELYYGVFSRFRTFISKYTKRPIVFLITGVNNFDSWRRIYDNLQPLAQYVIIVTTDDTEAKIGRDNMDRDGVDVVWIRAQKLDYTLTRKYIAARFAGQRPSNLPPGERESLEPFTEKTIEALFAPGPTAKSSDDVSYPIGWINTTLKRVLDEHFDRLCQVAINSPTNDVPPGNKLILPDQLERSRDVLNRGG
jgi:hypothetical protein